MDPSNTAWQNFLAGRNNDVYSVLDFDGYHIDQLGDWGTRYTYDGNPLYLGGTFGSFISAMKTAAPDKRLVFNAVNQYGQQASIGGSGVDFLYTEVWSPNDRYSSLADIIKDNNSFSGNTKSTELAAYMNYNLADNTGYFNAASVLFTDAVIFSFGGAHLELGEHMLGKEYFPNSNLAMTLDLKKSLTSYYDFFVAYQNLLRDGGSFTNPVITSSAGSYISLNSWPPQVGSVSVFGKTVGERQILHFINFRDNTIDWRDPSGSKRVPSDIQNLKLDLTTSLTVNRIWFASPDINNGNCSELQFQKNGNVISFALPSLKYWDMVVIE